MKKSLLVSLFCLVVLNQNSFAQGCPANLFFSEYIEGSSFNKVVEIYNPLPYSVDLGDYVLELYTNGSATASSQFFMAGIIGPNQTYVVAHPTSSAAILALKDTTSGVLIFNGDDAFILKHEFTFDTLDIIGIVGQDPGTSWAVGAGATVNNTLVRMSNVAIGTTNWSASSAQWIVLPNDDISNLGIHTFSAPSNVYNLQSISICDNDSVLVGSTYKYDTGIYYDTLPAFSGCDSVIITDLSLYPTYLTFKDTSTCPGNTVFIEGANQSMAGIYHDTLISVIGCDSVIEWNFTFLPEDFITDNVILCLGDSIFLEGGWQTLDGIYTDVYSSVITGCDSTVETTVVLYSVNTSVTGFGLTLVADDPGVNYQWLDCNNSMAQISGENSQTFAPLIDGDYAVEITDAGCVDTSLCFPVMGIGFIENQQLLFNLYPNPTNQLITLQLQKQSNGIVEILDLKGSVVASVSFNAQNKIEMNLSTLKAGVYFVRLSDESGYSIQRLIKQ